MITTVVVVIVVVIVIVIDPSILIKVRSIWDSKTVILRLMLALKVAIPVVIAN